MLVGVGLQRLVLLVVLLLHLHPALFEADVVLELPLLEPHLVVGFLRLELHLDLRLLDLAFAALRGCGLNLDAGVLLLDLRQRLLRLRRLELGVGLLLRGLGLELDHLGLLRPGL